jgi:hypothetical protein
LRGKAKANTIWHEVGHILFPSWKHWQIDLFGEVMARGGGRGHWARKYGKTPADMPPRSYLLKLSRKASKRMKNVSRARVLQTNKSNVSRNQKQTLHSQ